MLCVCSIFNNLKDWGRAHLFRISCILGAAGLGLLFVYWLFEFMLQPDKLKNLEGFLNTHPWSLITGLAAAPSLLLTWYWRDKAKRKELEQKDKDLKQRDEDLKQKDEDLKIAWESQLTERFAIAVKLLSSNSTASRMGGIYALERLSKNSEADHWAVMETLSAFVRGTAPWPPKGDKDESQEEIRPETDIQATLTVIGRRSKELRQYEKENEYQIDLSRSDLRGADLRKAHLEGVGLWETHLERANLEKARLEGAILSLAHLERAYLSTAHLEGAEIIEAHLEGAILNEAHLEGVFLNGAHLEGANLNLARLEGAYLGGAHLEGVHLSLSQLEGADLLLSTYNSKTKDGIEPTQFPKGFKLKEHGMIDSSKPNEAEQETERGET